MSNKHRVLVFGEKVFGGGIKGLALDYCDVEFLSYPNQFDSRPDLGKCDLVILDYSAFLTTGNSAHQTHQELFEKEMRHALSKGTNFCFLHYEDYVPDTMAFCMDNQIGFRWLSRSFGGRILAMNIKQPVVNLSVKRNEFKEFHSRWGSSKVVFFLDPLHNFDDVISCEENNDKNFLGFTVSVDRGKLIYLPCQRDIAKVEAIEACLTSLIESVITYLTRASAQIPAWAVTPVFENETLLHARLTELETEREVVKNNLEPYQVTKQLAFLGEYDFEQAVPKFFRQHLSLKTDSNEQFREDFWILTPNDEKIVICETKTHVGGLKKSDIFALYNHRDSNHLDETFPALLIVNVHRNANSWKEKLRNIDKQDYQVAAQNNILILRIEDLMFFWNLIAEGQKTSEDLLNCFLTEKGWMEVKQDGTITIHNK